MMSEASRRHEDGCFTNCVRRPSSEDRNPDFDGGIALGQEMNGTKEQTIDMPTLNSTGRKPPQMASTGRFEDLASRVDLQETVTNLKALQGVWIDTACAGIDTPVGHISHGQVDWNQRLFAGQHSSPLRLLSNGSIGMQVGSDTFTAVFCPGPPAANLIWNDGAIWIRDELQGLWMDSVGNPVGTIVGGKLLVGPQSKINAPCTVSPVPMFPNCVITLSCAGKSDLRAAYEPGPPAQLTWRNGTSWTRATLRT